MAILLVHYLGFSQTIGSVLTANARKVGEVEMRLIDADALADALFEKRKNYPQWVADTIGNMPDAIVRCKDCKHYEKDEYCPGFGDCMGACDNLVKVHGDWFCADGERED